MALGQAVDQVGRGPAGAAIHPHVQGPVGPEAKAPACVVQMRRCRAEIGQQHVGRPLVRLGQDRLDVREVRLEQPHLLERPQPLAGDGKVLRVPVDTDQPGAGARSPEQYRRVTTQPDRAVDNQLPAGRPKQLDHLVGQYRTVGPVAIHRNDAPSRSQGTAVHCGFRML